MCCYWGRKLGIQCTVLGIAWLLAHGSLVLEFKKIASLRDTSFIQSIRLRSYNTVQVYQIRVFFYYSTKIKFPIFSNRINSKIKSILSALATFS